MFLPLNKTVWRRNRILGSIIIGSMTTQHPAARQVTTGYFMRKGRECSASFVGSTTSLTQKNKSKKFNLEPAVRFKKKAVQENAKSNQHSAAISAELLSRVSTFNEEIERKEKTRDDVYYNTFLAMYWLAKKEIANKKFGSLLELLECDFSSTDLLA